MTDIKSFNTLIRLRQQEVDHLRKRVKELETKQAQFEGALRNVLAERDFERIAASKDHTLLAHFGGFLKRNRKQEEEFRAAIKRLQRQIDESREVLSEAFRTLKTLEIARDHEIERLAAEARAAEAKEMDEIGMQMHLRKGE